MTSLDEKHPSFPPGVGLDSSQVLWWTCWHPYPKEVDNEDLCSGRGPRPELYNYCTPLDGPYQTYNFSWYHLLTLTEHQLCDDAPSSGIDDQIIDGSMIEIGGSIDGIFVTKTRPDWWGDVDWCLELALEPPNVRTPGARCDSSRGCWSNQYDTMKGCPNLSRAPVIDCQEETLTQWEVAWPIWEK